MKFLTLPLTKQKKKQLKRSENIIQPRHCVVKLNRPVTNYHKLLFLSRSNPDENLKNKNQCKLFKSVIVTSNKLYFPCFNKSFKCTANNHRQLNFCDKFYPFVSVGMHGLGIRQFGIDSSILMLVSRGGSRAAATSRMDAL